MDAKNKKVILEGTVCLVKGQLEMFACTRRTKEHESILSVLTSANAVHAALLAIGAKPGKPVQFQPEYSPASGSEIDIQLNWVDKDGKEQTAKAQDWIQEFETKKAMTHPFVFPGSGFYVDENTGKRHYLADSGDFICVSNFSSAMLDLPIKSTDQKDEGILFSAFTARIPPKGTKVTMTLTVAKPKADAAPPKADDAKTPEKAAPAKSPAATK
ncbi:MAG: YdjY domain-containing protein [Pirellulales bacterium]